MSEDFKVEAVHGSSEWVGQHGPMITYNILANGEDLELNQKPTTPPPVVGQIIYGHTEPGNQGFPPKLRKDQRDGAGSSTSFHAAATPTQRAIANQPAEFDVREKRIVRQHSQEMAIRWIDHLGIAMISGKEGEPEAEQALLKWTTSSSAMRSGNLPLGLLPLPAVSRGRPTTASPSPAPISSDDANFLRNRVVDSKIDTGDVIAWLGARGVKNLDQLDEAGATAFSNWLDDSVAPF